MSGSAEAPSDDNVDDNDRRKRPRRVYEPAPEEEAHCTEEDRRLMAEHGVDILDDIVSESTIDTVEDVEIDDLLDLPGLDIFEQIVRRNNEFVRIQGADAPALILGFHQQMPLPMVNRWLRWVEYVFESTCREAIEGLQAVGHMRLITEYFMNIYPAVRAQIDDDNNGGGRWRCGACQIYH